MGIDRVFARVFRPATGRVAGSRFADAVVYDPLTLHPNWSYHSGRLTRMYGIGGEIYSHRYDPGDIHNIVYRDVQAESAVVSAMVHYGPTVDNYWTLPFAKIIDLHNLIGVRNNNNVIEFVERDGGVWITRGTIPGALTGFWEVEFTPTHVNLKVDGVDIGSIEHEKPGVGRFGISGHEQAVEGLLMLSNYNVVSDEITHNGEVVTYNGGAITMAELLDILNSGDVKSLRLDPPADESTVPNDALFTRADGELVHRKTDGSDEIIMANPEA